MKLRVASAVLLLTSLFFIPTAQAQTEQPASPTPVPQLRNQLRAELLFMGLENEGNVVDSDHVALRGMLDFRVDPKTLSGTFRLVHPPLDNSTAASNTIEGTLLVSTPMVNRPWSLTLRSSSIRTVGTLWLESVPWFPRAGLGGVPEQLPLPEAGVLLFSDQFARHLGVGRRSYAAVETQYAMSDPGPRTGYLQTTGPVIDNEILGGVFETQVANPNLYSVRLSLAGGVDLANDTKVDVGGTWNSNGSFGTANSHVNIKQLVGKGEVSYFHTGVTHDGSSLTGVIFEMTRVVVAQNCKNDDRNCSTLIGKAFGPRS